MFRKSLLIVLTASLAMSGPVAAKAGDFLVSNRFYGLLSAGAGVFFLLEAKDAKDDGDEAFARYEASGSSMLAREFYDQSREKDTKAAIMLGLGAGTFVYGVHLILKGDGEKLADPKLDRGLVEVKGVQIDAGADPSRGRVGVLLRRTF